MFNHDCQCFRLVIIGRDHIVVVVGLPIVIAIEELNIVGICEVGLRPTIQLRAVSDLSLLEDAFAAQVIVRASGKESCHQT